MIIGRVPTAEKCSLDTLVWFSLIRGSFVRTSFQIAHTLVASWFELVNMLIGAFGLQIQSFNM